MKKSVRKKIMVCFITIVCLLIGGCGDSSKDQTIAVYDYSDRYKRIDVFQTDGASAGQQKTDENRIIHMELYQYNDEIYCKACFDFSDQEHTAKLPAEISAQVEKLEMEGQ